MRKINILDDLTVNKIAAGEVVERPSSVVKELVENCIDAGSTKVVVEIEDGGKKLIKISDNGCGIASSEVDKSFLRHATSKINNINDLYDLYSLGFRGEALASICSVSKLEMITKTKEEAVGTKVVVEGGKIISKEPIGCNNGTTIVIKDIFYNTPVRQKFLKSNHAETINISDLINKLAIGNPHIQFKYTNNKKPMLNTPGDNKLISVIRSIYGKDVCENLIKVSHECEYFKVYGYIGNNNVYRANKNLQHIYINQRFVKSKIVLDAISEAYKSIIPINKHAVCFLNMEINPGSIDVNIHPTKLEIKFENEKEVYIELRDFLKRSLLNTPLIGKYETYEPKSSINTNLDKSYGTINKDTSNEDISPVKKLTPKEELELLSIPYKADLSEHKDIEVVDLNDDIDEGFMSLDEALEVKDTFVNDDKKELETKVTNICKQELYSSDKVYDLYVSEDTTNNDITKSIENSITKELDKSLINDLNVYDTNTHEESSSVAEDVQEMFFEQEEKEKFSIFSYNVIGTIFDTYIILSKGDAMYLLDQHAAHEKVLYERYMDKFYKSEINMQMLLDPVVVEVSNVDMLHIEKNLDLFMRFGFEIELFGNNHIMIRCVPTIFGVPESEKFILQIIDNIEDIKNSYELKGEKFASMACRAAIKANDKIKNIEINELFKEMQTCDNPFTCPHGRPVIVEISKKEIEKMFKRIM